MGGAEPAVVEDTEATAGDRKRRRKRRTKTSHSGVKLRSRSWAGGAVSWFARFVDPDTGKVVDVNLTKIGLKNEKARVTWAQRKSVSLKKRRAELASGAPKLTGTALGTALAAYLGETEGLPALVPVLADVAKAASTKRASTIAAARPALDRFLSWADSRGIASTDDVDEHNLAAFRAWITGARRNEPVAGERRGSRAAGERPLSKVSINSYLKSVKAALNQLRSVGLLPKIHSEEVLSKALKRVKEDKHEPVVLRAAEVRSLVLACMRHDEARFERTRDENAGRLPLGSTERYHAITPFVVFLLLTGCRLNEALSLTWDRVDLDAPDDHGRPIGRVRVTADASKTHEFRSVDLDVCPTLRTLLRALRERTGGHGRVFPEITEAVAKASVRRLTAPIPEQITSTEKRSRGQRTPPPRFGAPAFGWHTLRRTCGTFLVCAPGIYGSASVYLAAKRLGHSVEVAEKHYLNVVRGIDPTHRTLEDALGIEELVRDSLAGLSLLR